MLSAKIRNKFMLHNISLLYCTKQVTSKALSVSSSTESPPVGVTPDPLPPPLVPEIPAALFRFGQSKGDLSDFAKRRNEGDMCPIETPSAYLCVPRSGTTAVDKTNVPGAGGKDRRTIGCNLFYIVDTAVLAGSLVYIVHIRGLVGHKMRVTQYQSGIQTSRSISPSTLTYIRAPERLD